MESHMSHQMLLSLPCPRSRCSTGILDARCAPIAAASIGDFMSSHPPNDPCHKSMIAASFANHRWAFGEWIRAVG